jgi:hypothetical protein
MPVPPSRDADGIAGLKHDVQGGGTRLDLSPGAEPNFALHQGLAQIE